MTFYYNSLLYNMTFYYNSLLYVTLSTKIPILSVVVNLAIQLKFHFTIKKVNCNLTSVLVILYNT